MRSKQQQEQELDRLIDSILGFDSAALQRDMADGFDRYRRPENHLVAFYARVACLAVGLAVLLWALMLFSWLITKRDSKIAGVGKGKGTYEGIEI